MCANFPVACFHGFSLIPGFLSVIAPNQSLSETIPHWGGFAWAVGGLSHDPLVPPLCGYSTFPFSHGLSALSGKLVHGTRICPRQPTSSPSSGLCPSGIPSTGICCSCSICCPELRSRPVLCPCCPELLSSTGCGSSCNLVARTLIFCASGLREENWSCP